jgi:Flp pilus assembly protein TadG
MGEKRKTGRSGQALVLVTLALIAMAGIMGLAVDLGWSFFVQKQAQAAADAAALAAAQEAMQAARDVGVQVTALTCATAGVSCQATPVPCASATENLQNGCLYAKANGFDYTSASSRQNVTMMSGVTVPPPTAPGVMNVVYWVTARTVQTIPQLFSAVLGNSTGTVSAIATAAIVGSVLPASFYGMNHAGDCITYLQGTTVSLPACGLDVYSSNSSGQGNGNGTLSCPGAPGGTANLCAPAGIILASDCQATSNTQYCSQPYAGFANNGVVYGSTITVKADGALGSTNSGVWSPSTPTWSSVSKTFEDPYQGTPQPPIQVPSGGTLPACGIPGGSITTTNNSVTLGPYQYFSYHYDTNLGKNVADGLPITLPSNATFSSTGGCPGLTISGSGTSTGFPTYVFYGGLVTGDTVSFGAGQYVMAGTNSNAAGATVFNANDGSKGSNITGNSATGTMFIFTDGSYGYGQPWGLTQQSSVITGAAGFSGTMPTLYQGTLAFKNANMSLYGLVNSTNSGTGLPSAMNSYQGIVWWQDRRNSVVGYNEPSGYPGCTANCSGDDGTVLFCADTAECGTTTVPGQQISTAMALANNTTASSPGVAMDAGNGNIALHGVYYQPRGAWMEFVHGTTGFTCGATTNCPLQVVTGALIEDTGGTGLLLSGPTNPIVTYKTALIQ